MPAPTTTPDLAQTFALILGGLLRAAAARAGRNRAAAPLVILLFGRLNRMVARFAALVARAQAGPLPAPRRRPARPRPPRPRQPRLPQNFGWLVRLVPEAACFGSQLHHLLSDPAMRTLLKTAPQAGRILRPLCRMLAQKPHPTLLPPLPPKPAAPAPSHTEPPPAQPPGATPPRAGPPGPEPPRVEQPVVVWRRWRGIRMPEIWRPPKPA